MKKNLTIQETILALLITLLIPLIASAQHKGATPQATPQPYFFIHGWSLPKPYGVGSGQVTNVAGDMQSRFGWMSDQLVLPDYSGFIPGPYQGVVWADGYPSTGVHAQMYSAYPEGGYIGLGYSEGGMFARYEALTYGGSGFVTGLVTDHTPNNGTWIGDVSHRANLISRIVGSAGQLLRGDLGILTWVGAGLIDALELIFDFDFQSINLLATGLLGGLPQDAAPGSGILNTLNGTQPAVKRVAVWGKTEYPFIGYYFSDAYGAAYVDLYNQARKNSHDNDNIANSIHPHWYTAWKYLEQAWYRTRAGDWTATANAMTDDENAWEDNTAGRGDISDGLVGIESQKAIPSPDHAAYQDNSSCGCNTNHGGAVFYTPSTVPGTAGNSIGTAIEAALREVGAH